MHENVMKLMNVMKLFPVSTNETKVHFYREYDVYCISSQTRWNVDYNFAYHVVALCVVHLAWNSSDAARHRARLIPLITQTTPSASADPATIWSRKLIESSDQWMYIIMCAGGWLGRQMHLPLIQWRAFYLVPVIMLNRPFTRIMHFVATKKLDKMQVK